MAQFLPHIECISHQDNRLELKALVDGGLKAFEGHFPDFAVFPGVAQLAMVRQIVATYFVDLHTVEKIEQLRFQNFVLPDQQVFISLERHEQSVTFKFTNPAAQNVASGRMFFKG